MNKSMLKFCDLISRCSIITIINNKVLYLYSHSITFMLILKISLKERNEVHHCTSVSGLQAFVAVLN